MSQRLRVGTAQGVAAATAGAGDAGNDLLALLGRDEGALVFGMIGLGTGLSLAFCFGGFALGVWMFGRGWFGVAGVLEALCFQLGNTSGEAFDLLRLPLNQGNDSGWQRSQDIR